MPQVATVCVQKSEQNIVLEKIRNILQVVKMKKIYGHDTFTQSCKNSILSPSKVSKHTVTID